MLIFKQMKRVVKHVKRLKELRVINNLLTLVIMGLGLYIIVAPFWPQAEYWIQEESPLKTWASQSSKVEASADDTVGSNRLFIPKLGLSELVYDGAHEPLSKGVIHRPRTSTPDEDSNTVLVGHRFMYSERGVFYHLDKLVVGDEITVHWQLSRYNYRVTEVKVVPPSEISVEASTDEAILTLYTCTPLWSSKDRLVVIAKPVEGTP